MPLLPNALRIGVSVRLGLGWCLADASSVACGRQLTAHRTSRSGCSGVPHGLFSISAPQEPLFRNAHASGLRPSVCAPNFSFRKARCSGQLIFQKQSTGLFLPKRSTSRASPLHLRTETDHRTVYSETLDLQGFTPSGVTLKGKPKGTPLLPA